MPDQIHLTPHFPFEPYEIPFEEGTSLMLKIKVPISIDNTSEFKSRGVDVFITHYFPEFYKAMKDPNYDGDLTVYNDLRNTLTDMITIHLDGPPVPFKHELKTVSGALANSAPNILEIRAALDARGDLPDFQENLEYFNSRSNISSEIVDRQELELGKIGTTTNNLVDVTMSLAGQQNNYSGPVAQQGVNFDFLGHHQAEMYSCHHSY